MPTRAVATMNPAPNAISSRWVARPVLEAAVITRPPNRFAPAAARAYSNATVNCGGTGIGERIQPRGPGWASRATWRQPRTSSTASALQDHEGGGVVVGVGQGEVDVCDPALAGVLRGAPGEPQGGIAGVGGDDLDVLPAPAGAPAGAERLEEGLL